MTTHRVIIVGAGNVGLALAGLLARTGDFAVALVDGVDEAVDRANALGFSSAHCDAAHQRDLRALLKGADAVVAATPEEIAPLVAAAADMVGAPHLDFCPGAGTATAIRPRDLDAPAAFTRCGVAPGLIGALAAELVAGFSVVDELVARVGAIPQVPTNRLGYGRIWNVDGLIGEYTRPSEAIVDGRAALIPPLGGLETFTLAGRPYEAFVTAGGMTILPEQLGVTVRNATFKTIRHPGHLDYMRFLLDDLGLAGRRDLLANLLMNGLPVVEKDEVLVYVTARGTAGSHACERSAVWRIRPEEDAALGFPVNALARGAAAHAATVLDLLRTGAVPATGPFRLETIPVATLRASRFLGEMLQPVEPAPEATPA